MTLYSQNGWPVITRAQCVKFEVAGWTAYAANDDVALLADELLTRVNEVEPISEGKVRDDWSHSDPRPVRGQTTGFSNHSSATAFDDNALEHPRGVKNTWTKDELHAIGLILNSMTDDSGRPVWRWGEHYEHSPTDGMHFEINATARQVHQAAQKLRKKRLAMALVEIDTDKFILDQVELTDEANRVLGNKPGTKVSVRYLLSWGGARGKKTEDQINALALDVAHARTELATLTEKVNVVTDMAAEILRQVTPPDDAMKPAVHG